MTLRITGNSAILDCHASLLISDLQCIVSKYYLVFTVRDLEEWITTVKIPATCFFLYSSLSTSQLTWDMFSEISDLESFK